MFLQGLVVALVALVALVTLVVYANEEGLSRAS
jgi:hypothetical protein